MPRRRAAAAALCLPHRIEMSHAGAGRGDGAQRRLAGLGRRAGDREDRQHAVADELSTSPPNACTAPAMRSNQASSAAITAAGSVASESAVKSRRSAESNAARIVSPVPRRAAPACTRAALRRPR
jgi:hypothetical protein